MLRWSYVAIGGIGLAFYVYRELLARFFLSLHDYEVDTVTPAGEGLVEISLRPLGRPVTFVPGQFALVYIEAKDGWHRHPFTIASAPAEGVVRVTVKALGDYTSSLRRPARARDACGDRRAARPLRPREGHPRPGLDRRRCRRRPVPELDARARRTTRRRARSTSTTPSPAARRRSPTSWPPSARPATGVRVHLVDSAVDGRLSAERIIAEATAAPAELSVFLCGPEAMLRDLQSGLRERGVRPQQRPPGVLRLALSLNPSLCLVDLAWTLHPARRGRLTRS